MKKLFYSSLGLLLVALLFVVFNMLSGLLFKHVQLDLTDEKRYTLTQGTRQLLAQLPEPIELYFYYSNQAARDLPQVRNHAQRIQELLQLYVRLADGQLSLQTIEPQPFSVEEDQAAQMGLQAMRLPAGESLYLGLAGKNRQADVQSIAFFSLEQEQLLEYELSRLLQSLAQPSQPVVGVMTQLPLAGAVNPISGQAMPAWTVFEEVRQQFQIEYLDTSLDEIPPELGVLWLVHPQNLPSSTLYAIDQFVLRGGKLLVFVDPFSEVDSQPGLASVDVPIRASGLPELFAAWGLRLRTDSVVGDARYAMTVSLSESQRTVRHPGWLSLPEQAFNHEDVVIAPLHSLTLASAGILEPLEGATTQFSPLLQSSGQAMPYSAQRFSALRDPLELAADLQPSGEHYTLAARINGPAKTAFAEGLEGQLPGLSSGTIHLMVVADTDMLNDRMWVQVQDYYGQRLPQPWADNGRFVVNALENLLGSDDLLQVRSRARFSRPFTLVDQLREHALERYAQTEQQLQQHLQEAEQKLAQLQVDSGEPGSTVQHQAAIQELAEQRLQVRQQLREVRYQLNADIERLGRWVKLFNIVLMPLVLSFAMVLIGLHRRIRRMQPQL